MTDADKIKMLRKALQFYANQEHFTIHDSMVWDTVSGEPQNFYEHEDNSATVEDGSVAKMTLEKIDATAPTQPEPERDERAEFESYAGKRFLDLTRKGDSYRNNQTHEAWQAWQAWLARAALERK